MFHSWWRECGRLCVTCFIVIACCCATEGFPVCQNRNNFDDIIMAENWCSKFPVTDGVSQYHQPASSTSANSFAPEKNNAVGKEGYRILSVVLSYEDIELAKLIILPLAIAGLNRLNLAHRRGLHFQEMLTAFQTHCLLAVLVLCRVVNRGFLVIKAHPRIQRSGRRCYRFLKMRFERSALRRISYYLKSVAYVPKPLVGTNISECYDTSGYASDESIEVLEGEVKTVQTETENSEFSNLATEEAKQGSVFVSDSEGIDLVASTQQKQEEKIFAAVKDIGVNQDDCNHIPQKSKKVETEDKDSQYQIDKNQESVSNTCEHSTALLEEVEANSGEAELNINQEDCKRSPQKSEKVKTEDKDSKYQIDKNQESVSNTCEHSTVLVEEVEANSGEAKALSLEPKYISHTSINNCNGEKYPDSFGCGYDKPLQPNEAPKGKEEVFSIPSTSGCPLNQIHSSEKLLLSLDHTIGCVQPKRTQTSALEHPAIFHNVSEGITLAQKTIPSENVNLLESLRSASNLFRQQLVSDVSEKKKGEEIAEQMWKLYQKSQESNRSVLHVLEKQCDILAFEVAKKRRKSRKLVKRVFGLFCKGRRRSLQQMEEMLEFLDSESRAAREQAERYDQLVEKVREEKAIAKSRRKMLAKEVQNRQQAIVHRVRRGFELRAEFQGARSQDLPLKCYDCSVGSHFAPFGDDRAEFINTMFPESEGFCLSCPVVQSVWARYSALSLDLDVVSADDVVDNLKALEKQVERSLFEQCYLHDGLFVL